MQTTGITVAGLGIPVPGKQPRLTHFAAENENRLFPPVQLRSQGRKKPRRGGAEIQGRCVTNFSAREIQGLKRFGVKQESARHHSDSRLDPGVA